MIVHDLSTKTIKQQEVTPSLTCRELCDLVSHNTTHFIKQGGIILDRHSIVSVESLNITHLYLISEKVQYTTELQQLKSFGLQLSDAELLTLLGQTNGSVDQVVTIFFESYI